MLDELGIELIGARLDVIHRAEDRQLFREAVAVGRPAGADARGSSPSLDELAGVEPAGRRPSGLHARRPRRRLRLDRGPSCARRSSAASRESPIGQVLVEESVRGWDEFELEVVRDRIDNVVIVCSIENLDPMGVHTGDSVTVAPQMTLSDEAYQELRDAAVAIIRAVGVDTGGSNIQFARDRDTGELRVIEMNPRVSRSSALASKATGYPIAKVAAKLAVGYTLDEIPNDLTGTTPASFEPTLDYVVVKFPRFAFEKFPGADTTLGTQMKSVGETMGIGRTFTEAFLKAMRSRELDRGAETPWHTLADVPPRRPPLVPGGDLHASRTRSTASRRSTTSSASDWVRLKRLGLSDADIADACDATEVEARRRRLEWGVRPVVPPRRLVRRRGRGGLELLLLDLGRGRRGAAEGPLRVVILGSGPNRIGQGIEFDYCCVHAARSFRALGYEAVMVNCNPETVSTDYDTSDRLYFEPLGVEEVLAVCEREQPDGVVIQFGGQTPLKLARAIEEAGYRIIGTPFDAIDLAEDRERFGALLERLGIRCPEWGIVEEPDEAVELAERIGYPGADPALVRARRPRDARLLPAGGRARGARAPVYGRVLVDRFLENAIEIDVDALSRRRTTPTSRAVMQHVEEAGVHSGDSACVLPAPSLTAATAAEIHETTRTLAAALGVVGLLNVQLAVADGEVYVLEVEPARVAHRAVRVARRPASTSSRPPAASPPGRSSPTSGCRRERAPAQCQRQGGRAAVRPLPRRRSGARPGDALDRRGDGERRRPADRVRQGRARRGAPAADDAARCSSRSATPTRRRSCRSRRRSPGSASSSSRRRGPPRRSPPPGSRSSRCARCGEAGDGPTVVDLIRRGRCDLVDQHAAGLGRARRRLPDPRGRARRAASRASRRISGAAAGGARDRERARRAGRARSRSGSMPRRERRSVVARRGGRAVHAPAARRAAGSSPACPGQFFMLEAPGRLLPRPMSLCLAPPGELAFLIDPVGPGTRALCALEPGERIHVFGPLGNGFRLDVERPLLVGGGIGIAPLPYLSEVLGGPPAVLGFRTAHHAEAAALVPNARGRDRADARHRARSTRSCDVLACGPEPMLEAVARARPRTRSSRGRRRWRAATARCYGCVVEIDGELQAPLRRRAGTECS